MGKGSHGHRADRRNADILINIDGRLVPRAEARVSVFDSGFLLGDGVWEGLRIHNGQIVFADAHFDRLFDGARAIDLDIGLDREALRRRVYETLAANGMENGVHVRLMVTRGIRATPYQDPRVTEGGPTIVIIAEYKEADARVLKKGITLFTVHVRRGAPDVQDPELNSHSKLNCITACIQAAKAGADEALMLDPHGFVATCNSTNFFIVRDGAVRTAREKYLMPGITRARVIALCRENQIPVIEDDFSLARCYAADEAFVTGTFAGLVPVGEIDGRIIGDGNRGPLTGRLQGLYARLVDDHCPPPGPVDDS